MFTYKPTIQLIPEKGPAISATGERQRFRRVLSPQEPDSLRRSRTEGTRRSLGSGSLAAAQGAPGRRPPAPGLGGGSLGRMCDSVDSMCDSEGPQTDAFCSGQTADGQRPWPPAVSASRVARGETHARAREETEKRDDAGEKNVRSLRLASPSTALPARSPPPPGPGRLPRPGREGALFSPPTSCHLLASNTLPFGGTASGRWLSLRKGSGLVSGVQLGPPCGKVWLGRELARHGSV